MHFLQGFVFDSYQYPQRHQSDRYRRQEQQILELRVTDTTELRIYRSHRHDSYWIRSRRNRYWSCERQSWSCCERQIVLETPEPTEQQPPARVDRPTATGVDQTTATTVDCTTYWSHWNDSHCSQSTTLEPLERQPPESIERQPPESIEQQPLESLERQPLLESIDSYWGRLTATTISDCRKKTLLNIFVTKKTQRFARRIEYQFYRTFVFNSHNKHQNTQKLARWSLYQVNQPLWRHCRH